MTKINIAELFSKIELCKNAIIVGHSHPDGDCVGSAVALAALIEALGGKAQVIFPEKAPARLGFILEERNELEELPENLDGYDFIGIDLASPIQMASLRETLEVRFALRIDHHEVCVPYARNEFVDANASAAGMLVFGIWEYAVASGKVKGYTKEALTALFAAISSDTGCFKYANVTDETHITAAKLIALGAPAAYINRMLFDTKEMNQLKAEGIAISRLESFDGGAISAVALDLCDYGGDLGIKDFETGIDIARCVRGTRCAVIVKASPTPETYRVSLRANDDTDVSAVAAVFGGGGHVRAAGCTILGSSAREVLLKVVAELRKVM